MRSLLIVDHQTTVGSQAKVIDGMQLDAAQMGEIDWTVFD